MRNSECPVIYHLPLSIRELEMEPTHSLSKGDVVIEQASQMCLSYLTVMIDMGTIKFLPQSFLLTTCIPCPLFQEYIQLFLL